jgi:hypothetical protein
VTAVREVVDTTVVTPAPQHESKTTRVLTVVFVAVVQLFAFTTMWLAYRNIQGAAQQSNYVLFWLSLLSALLVTIWVVATHIYRRGLVAWSIVALGLLTYLPMYFRRPRAVFFDEIAHLRQTQELASTGHLDPWSIVPVLPSFPGLHIVTATISRLGHIDVWTSAHILLFACHVMALLGIWSLARMLNLKSPIPELAAIVYAVHPGFLYFLSQFAYESLAIVVQIWALVVFVWLVRRPHENAKFGLPIFGLLALTVVATHHLTAVFLTLFVFTAVVAMIITRAPRDQLRVAAEAALIAFVVTGVWILLHSPGTVSYLANFPQQGLKQIIALIEGKHATGGARSAFGSTALPKYEPLIAYAQPLIVLGLWIIGVLVMWKQRKEAYAWWLVGITGAYFLTLPLILTALGAAPAHRSWPFLWQAGSILMAISLMAIVSWSSRVRYGRALGWALTAGLLTALFIGSAASDFNAEARFPGVFESGIDGRQVDAETYKVAEFLRRDVPAGTHFVASDQYTAGAIAGLTRLVYDDKFPTWDVLFYPPPLEDRRRDALQHSGNKYLIIDTRIADTPFRGGYYLNSNEPGAFERTEPLPPSALTKLATDPAFVLDFKTEHMRVYEITRNDEKGQTPADEAAEPDGAKVTG